MQSHHLLLHAPSGLSLHHVATLVGVADVGQAEGTTAILVALELRDGLGSILLLGELNHTSATRATCRLILDLCTLDLTDRGEELDQVVVAGAPREL